MANKARLEGVDVDAPTDLGRLAIETGIWGVRLWLYAPPAGELPVEEATPEGRVDWIASHARANLANLVLPGYSFSKDRPTFDDMDSPYSIIAYACTPADERYGWQFTGGSGVENYLPEYFIDAIAPPCSGADKMLLRYNVQTYHTAKIEMLLRTLSNISI